MDGTAIHVESRIPQHNVDDVVKDKWTIRAIFIVSVEFGKNFVRLLKGLAKAVRHSLDKLYQMSVQRAMTDSLVAAMVATARVIIWEAALEDCCRPIAFSVEVFWQIIRWKTKAEQIWMNLLRHRCAYCNRKS